jgi:coproporphyrinogen III oxidase
VSGGQDMTGYYPRETDRSGYHSLRENDTLGASYDRYLRNGVHTQFSYCTTFFFVRAQSY